MPSSQAPLLDEAVVVTADEGRLQVAPQGAIPFVTLAKYQSNRLTGSSLRRRPLNLSAINWWCSAERTAGSAETRILISAPKHSCAWRAL